MSTDDDTTTASPASPIDPIRVKRTKIAKWTLLANRVGYLFVALAMALFVMAFVLGFNSTMATLVAERQHIFQTDDENEIKSIQVPPIDESMPIYHHWENVSQRLMTALSRVENVHHFNQPVDPNVCSDYNNIIKNPMDFGLIKSKLKTH